MLLGQRTGGKKGNNEQEEEEGQEKGEEEKEEEVNQKLTLANLVVWFREFITVLDDAAVGVGGGGEGPWGSRPPRLLRVIEQRAGCAHEAAQLFVSLSRGLGLRARYVACLDPVPPSPCPSSSEGLSKPPRLRQTRNNTVDLTTAGEGQRGRRRRQQQHQGQQRWRRGAFGGVQAAKRGGAGYPQAWAEVLCRDDGRELVRMRRNNGGDRSLFVVGGRRGRGGYEDLCFFL